MPEAIAAFFFLKPCNETAKPLCSNYHHINVKLVCLKFGYDQRMALLRRFQALRSLNRTFEFQHSSYLLGSSRSYTSDVSIGVRILPTGDSCLYRGHVPRLWPHGSTMSIHSTLAIELSTFLNDKRLVTTQAKAPPQTRQMGAFKVAMSSPGFVYEPYGPREPISFWQRWFTKTGWQRTKDDCILEMKSAYAIMKLKKSGYSKKKFYIEAIEIYKEINILLANGDKMALRKLVTERMHSALKNEIKQRETRWNSIYWELLEPVVLIRTLRARLIGVDRTDLEKAFAQLTLEITTKQKFEAYDSKGAVVAGDKNKEVLVKDIWVLEKSLFHPGSTWRLCGRITL